MPANCKALVHGQRDSELIRFKNEQRHHICVVTARTSEKKVFTFRHVHSYFIFFLLEVLFI